MTNPRPKSIYALIVVHFFLAIAPLGTAFIPFNSLSLPLMWALSSIPFSQIMLLSMWLGMTPGKLLSKSILAIFAISYLGVWIATGSVLMSSEVSVVSTLPEYLRIITVSLVMLAILSVVMAGASHLMGSICYTKGCDRVLKDSRFQFSLFAILALATITCVVLGLVRLSRDNSDSDESVIVVIQTFFAVVVFALNLLTTIWATLGAARVITRLLIVFVVAVLLGCSMAIGAGHSPFSEHWWLFASFTLIVLVPTTIVTLTLLYLRRLGYRLTLPVEKSDTAIKPSVWDEKSNL